MKDITVVEIENNSVQTLSGHNARIKSLDFVRYNKLVTFVLFNVD